MSESVLREILEQLATCASMVCSAVRDEDAIKFHYGIEGTEFEVMRAAWYLGDRAEAERIHPLVGDHSPNACPICVGDEAFDLGVIA